MRELKTWIESCLREPILLSSLHGDASFRSYYRVKASQTTYVAMFAPPSKEETEPFVAIARAWQEHGIQVPEIFHWQKEKGFVLLSDFGDDLLIAKLTSETVHDYYQEAMKVLIQIQQTPSSSLPEFDEKHIRKELSLFSEWFIEGLLQKKPSLLMTEQIEKIFTLLVRNALEQPQVTIHRDYHWRNIMLHEKKLGIIDFQDAMAGPLTYDLVSLLKDCYIQWDRKKIYAWLQHFFNLWQETFHPLTPPEFHQFKKWFDWIGLQRHLKVLGIFSRLKLRDNKPQYLNDIPRVLSYSLEVTSQYEELFSLGEYLQELTPTLNEILSKKEQVLL